MNQGEPITPEKILELTTPIDGFLCGLDANTYGIEFVYFKIRNYENNYTLCEIKKK